MQLISFKEVQKRLSIGRTALWKLTKLDNFPKPIKVTVGRKAFIETEIDAWIEERAAERDEVVA